MKIVADMHTHSNISTHAYSTIMENCIAAKNRGLLAIASTDHGPEIADGATVNHFLSLREDVLSQKVDGVRLIRGIEANILDANGRVDVDPAWKNLEFGIASIHDNFEDEGIEACTQAYLKVLENPMIDLLGHPGTVRYAFDYETVVKRCGELGKLIEINGASFRHRKSSITNCKKLALLCKKYGVGIMVNSDAHFCMRIGDVEGPMRLLSEIDFPEKLLINGSKQRLNDYLKQRRGIDLMLD